jgi:hypothetical protein
MSQKRVAIVQSSYIPWKGYFDLIRACDEFILLDDVQFTRRDWRSRNRVKTKDGLLWLTIPVHSTGRYSQAIQDVTVSDPTWGARHWRTIRESYARTPFFAAYAPILEPLYQRPVSDRLSRINHSFITAICGILGIATRISWSTDYEAREGRNERLMDLCQKAGATDYLSGPSAREYLDVNAFAAAGVTARFVDYSGYPEYPQPHPPFEHAVSVLDLLFSAGPNACEYLRHLCPSASPA